MSYIFEHLSSFIANGGETAQAILLISTAILLGLGLGSLKVAKISFGSAGVLFGGIIVAQLCPKPDHHVLEFCREFGLMIFVFLTGLQAGPGFFSAFKKQGFVLNLLAILIVVLGVIVTVIIGKVFFSAEPFSLAIGLLTGATTNTPSLGAANQAIIEMGKPDLSSLTGIGYAVAYPFGVAGIILTIISLKYLLKIDITGEKSKFDAEWGVKGPELNQANIRVDNPNIYGKYLNDVIHTTVPNVVVSRILQNGDLKVARNKTILREGDVLLAVGCHQGLKNFQMLVGSRVDIDLTDHPSTLDVYTAVVTAKCIIGKSFSEINLSGRFNVKPTRLIRAGIEMLAYPQTRLQFGDSVVIVGESSMLSDVARELGDSVAALTATRMGPLFFGLALGILVGTIPFHMPGIPAPIKLGLAGGPLVTAILLGRIGKIGPLIWHMPEIAGKALRDFGIVLFLACIGIKAGDGFVKILFSTEGLYLLLAGASITIIPLVIVGALARLFLKLNFISLTGMLAGSMTDPPALSFADTLTQSKGPALAYSTVYPMVMIARIISTQILVLIFC